MVRVAVAVAVVLASEDVFAMCALQIGMGLIAAAV